MSCAALLLTQEDSRLTIGLTGDQMLCKKQNAEIIQNYGVRKFYLETFLNKFSPNLILNVKINLIFNVKINNINS